MQFTQAQRKRAKLKLAVTGPPGSGKTMSALRLASGLVGPGGRIAVIDTENKSASLYADRFKFDVLDIQPPFESQKFVDAIKAAVAAGYDCLIIDSASHFWRGVLEFKSDLDARGGNSFTNWNQAGKKYDEGLSGILQSDIHLIACMRSKIEYVVEQDIKGKATPRKIGLAPVFRDEGEYEFTTVFDVAHDHKAQVSKDRTGLFTDRIFQVTEEVGGMIGAWLDGGAAPAPAQPTEPAVAVTTTKVRVTRPPGPPNPPPAAPPRPAEPAAMDEQEAKDRAAFVDLVMPHREQSVAWMIKEGWMTADGDLGAPGTVSLENIRKVLKRPAAFLRAVQQSAVAAGAK